MDDLIGSLEAHEMIILERKGVEKSIQTLQTWVFKLSDDFERHKGKKIQDKFKEYRSSRF